MAKREIRARVRVTPKIFEQCYALLETIDNKEDYIEKALDLEVWDDENVTRDCRDEWLGKVWEAYHRDLRDIIDMTGMKVTQFYRYFGIPRRTLQDWLYEKNNPPRYTLFMMQEILGYVTRY